MTTLPPVATTTIPEDILSSSVQRFVAIAGTSSWATIRDTEALNQVLIPVNEPPDGATPPELVEQPLRTPTGDDAARLAPTILEQLGNQTRITPFLLGGINDESGRFVVMWVAAAEYEPERHVYCAAALSISAEGERAGTVSWGCSNPSDRSSDLRYELAIVGDNPYLEDQDQFLRPVEIGAANVDLQTVHAVLVTPNGGRWLQRPVGGTVLFSVDPAVVEGPYEILTYDAAGNDLGVGRATLAAPTSPPTNTADDAPRFTDRLVAGQPYQWYDWPSVADSIRRGETSEISLLGVRHKLADVEEGVAGIADATALMFGSTEVYEEAFLVLDDGSDTMAYIGWADRGPGEELVKKPIIDGMTTEQWGEIAVSARVTETTVDFLAHTDEAVATVRFFALDDRYGVVPITTPPAELREIAGDVFRALALGNLG
jgi:hypothetical protein